VAAAMKEQERLIKGAMRRWMMRNLSAAWNTWRALASRLKRQESLLRHGCGSLMNRLLSRAFHQWLFQTRKADSDRYLLTLGGMRWVRLKEYRHFRTWRDNNQVMLEAKRKVAHALGHWCNLQLAQVWNRWVLWHAELLQQKMLAIQAVRKWRARERARAYNKWVEHAAQARHQHQILRKSLGRWLLGEMSKALQKWLTHNQEAREQRDLMRRAAGRMRNTLLAQAFSRWSEQLAHVLYMKSLGHHSVGHWRHVLLSRAFNKWLVATTRKEVQVVKEVVKEVDDGMLRLLQQQLNDANRIIQELRDEIARLKLLGYVDTGALEGALGQLEKQNEVKKSKVQSTKTDRPPSAAEAWRRGIAKWKHLWLSRAWNKWRQGASPILSPSKDDLRLLRHGVMRFMAFQWSACFDLWRDTSARLRRSQRIMTMCILRCNKSRCRHYLIAWQHWVEEKRLHDLEADLDITKTKAAHLSNTVNSPKSSPAGPGLAGFSPRSRANQAPIIEDDEFQDAPDPSCTLDGAARAMLDSALARSRWEYATGDVSKQASAVNRWQRESKGQ